MLKVLSTVKGPKQRKAMLLNSNNDLMMAICEIVDNVLRGTVKLRPSDRKKLSKYKSVLREMADRSLAKKKKKTLLLSQRGGFLPLVLAPALALVASLVGEVVGKAIR